MKMKTLSLIVALAIGAAGADAPNSVVVDFEGVTVLLAPNDKANRAEQLEEKGVIFKLAREPRSTKAKGLVMFFEHLASGHKGIGSAMALEPIPVQATFPKPVRSVTVTFWGSAGAPVSLQAFDADGKVVDRAELSAIPGRKAPGDAEPTFSLSVSSEKIASIQFSGPRPGEFVAADEVRFVAAVEK
jgi:hypothetical protein